MDKRIPSFEQSRRQFFSKILPVGSLCCFGCSTCFASAQSEKKHKFLEDSGMSFKEVYIFAFKNRLIPLMQNLSNDIGKDKFIEMLKRASSEYTSQSAQDRIQNLPKNDLAAFTAWTKEPNPFYNHVLTYEIVEETDKAFGMKVTECLWAETFRDANASDIGYATNCHPDYAYARAFNPKMRMIRTKTLMQGHDCCNFRWILEG